MTAPYMGPEVPRGVEPQNLSKAPIRTNYVDIYLLPEQVRIECAADQSRFALPWGADQGDKDKYRAAIAGEPRFMPDGPVKAGLQSLLSADAPVEQLHEYLVQHGKGKLGLRDLVLDGNVLRGAAGVVPFPAYDEFGTQENKPNMRAFGSIVGAAFVVVTADNKLVLQHRRPCGDLMEKGNRNYGDDLGLGTAGLVDAAIWTPGQSLDIIDLAKRSTITEGSEEIGLAEHQIAELRFAAMGLDKLKLHIEAVFFVRTKVTGDELEENAMRNPQQPSHQAFKENIVIFDNYSPDLVAEILGEVRNPLPTSHAGAVLIGGHSEVVAQHGAYAADQWISREAVRMDENYAAINDIIGGQWNPGRSCRAQNLEPLEDIIARKFAGRARYVKCGWDPASLKS